MYRTSSPSLFDIPDFPTLRRVKPLPKRRRTSLNINGGGDGMNDPSQSLQQQGSHTTYVSSAAYHSRMHPPLPPFPPPVRDSSNQFRANAQAITHAADTLSSSIDAFHSHSERRIHPDIFHIPDDILKVATVIPVKTDSTPKIDDDGGDGDDDSNKDLSFVGDHKSQQHQGGATPPPPSNESTEDEEDSQTPPLPSHSQYRPSFVRPQRKEPSGDEEIDLEGTEGDLQERLFLRAETDRLLAHADSLSARMALQSYYRSMGYSTPEFSSGVDASPVPTPVSASGMLDHSTKEYVRTPPLPTTSDSGNVTSAAAGGNGYIAVNVGRGQMSEGDGDGHGDYADHSSQQGQGNTKKRKVPANVGSSPPHHYHNHHHSYHYPSYRGAFGVGSREGEEVDGEFSFGFGFGLEGTSMEGNTFPGGGEDVFGPLPGSMAGAYQQHQSPEGQLPQRQFHRKAKLSTVTLAGLQRKELIRSRKKQLEAIMGTLPVGDTWALDYALSANFPPLLSSFSSMGSSSSTNSPVTDSDYGASGTAREKGGGNWEVGWGWAEGEKEVKVRLSKRRKMRVARGARIGLERLGRHPDAAPFPTGKFEFDYLSAITERWAAIQEEVANLRNLFGVELTKQTAKAAKIATRNGKGTGGNSGKTGKKRVQQRARTGANAKSGEQQAEFLEMPQKGTDSPTQQQLVPQGAQGDNQSASQAPTPKKGKKKKRSTLANASNPHHLRNYVPSRLPHAAGGGGSGGGIHGQANQAGNVNLFWPPALRFLSAQLPPRKRKGANGGGQNSVNVQQLVVPQEEWICSFCEHSLFYGDDAEYRRAVRNRKKILRRRRRARERAAAAASGVNAAMKNAAGIAEKTHVEDEEYDGPGYESMASNNANVRVDGGGRPRTREAPG